MDMDDVYSGMKSRSKLIGLNLIKPFFIYLLNKADIEFKIRKNHHQRWILDF